MSSIYGRFAICAVFFLHGCYPNQIVLHHGIEWIQPGKRDFQLNVGAGVLRNVPKSDVENVLRKILATEIAKAQICPNGYEVTNFSGYEGGSTLAVEGRCLPETK